MEISHLSKMNGFSWELKKAWFSLRQMQTSNVSSLEKYTEG